MSDKTPSDSNRTPEQPTEERGSELGGATGSELVRLFLSAKRTGYCEEEMVPLRAAFRSMGYDVSDTDLGEAFAQLCDEDLSASWTSLDYWGGAEGVAKRLVKKGFLVPNT